MTDIPEFPNLTELNRRHIVNALKIWSGEFGPIKLDGKGLWMDDVKKLLAKVGMTESWSKGSNKCAHGVGPVYDGKATNCYECELDSLRTQLKELHGSMIEKEDQRDDLSIELAGMEAKHTRLLEDFQRIDGKLDEARASLDAVKKDRDIANAARSRLAGELEAVYKALGVCSNGDALEKAKWLDKELTATLKDAAKLRDEIKSTRKWALGFQAELHAALADAARRGDVLEKRIAEAVRKAEKRKFSITDSAFDD